MFVRCDLTGARFRGARMSSVAFLGCDLSATSGVDGLAGSSLDEPTLQSAAVSLARGLGVEVTRVEIAGVGGPAGPGPGTAAL